MGKNTPRSLLEIFKPDSGLNVEAVLDGGTDQGRRWSGERLVLPGGGPVILGTFDVEP